MRTSTKLFFTALLGCFIAACAGCASVPATEITIPKYGTIKSPKQIELKNLSIKTSDGVEVIIGEIRSVNDAAIIGSVGQANVDLMRETGLLVDKIRAATQSGATGGGVP